MLRLEFRVVWIRSDGATGSISMSTAESARDILSAFPAPTFKAHVESREVTLWKRVEFDADIGDST